MKDTFKISTFVTKILFLSLIMASFSLSAVRAEDGTKEETKRVFGKLRLHLWYVGINSLETPVNNNKTPYYDEIEELKGPIDKFLKGSQR